MLNLSKKSKSALVGLMVLPIGMLAWACSSTPSPGEDEVSYHPLENTPANPCHPATQPGCIAAEGCIGEIEVPTTPPPNAPYPSTWKETADGINAFSAGGHYVAVPDPARPGNTKWQWSFGESCLNANILIETNPGPGNVHPHFAAFTDAGVGIVGHPFCFDCRIACQNRKRTGGTCDNTVKMTDEIDSTIDRPSAVCKCDPADGGAGGGPSSTASSGGGGGAGSVSSSSSAQAGSGGGASSSVQASSSSGFGGGFGGGASSSVQSSSSGGFGGYAP